VLVCNKRIVQGEEEVSEREEGESYALPSVIARSAMRMYIPFSAWRKYAARGSESTSGEISVRRGSGCMMIMCSEERRRIEGVTV
jgi:hypothetical protein